jgi:hypothetical protein
MSGEESLFEDSFGGLQHGPGPEDFANGAAALGAALVRGAEALAQSAAGLRAVCATVIGDHGGGPLSDVRRQRAALAAAGEAALRAALALEAAEILGQPADGAARAERMAKAAQRVGLAPLALAPLLRAAAMDFRGDDAAARIAATIIAQDIVQRLERG